MRMCCWKNSLGTTFSSKSSILVKSIRCFGSPETSNASKKTKRLVSDGARILRDPSPNDFQGLDCIRPGHKVARVGMNLDVTESIDRPAVVIGFDLQPAGVEQVSFGRFSR